MEESGEHVNQVSGEIGDSGELGESGETCESGDLGESYDTGESDQMKIRHASLLNLASPGK